MSFYMHNCFLNQLPRNRSRETTLCLFLHHGALAVDFPSVFKKQSAGTGKRFGISSFECIAVSSGRFRFFCLFNGVVWCEVAAAFESPFSGKCRSRHPFMMAFFGNSSLRMRVQIDPEVDVVKTMRNMETNARIMYTMIERSVNLQP